MEFDFTKEKDIEDFFNIWKEKVAKATRTLCDGVVLKNKDGYELLKIPENYITINWGNLEYVERPKNYSKWIGKLCYFWEDYDKNRKALGILKETYKGVDGKDRFVTHLCATWKHCEPVKEGEIEFFKE